MSAGSSRGRTPRTSRSASRTSRPHARSWRPRASSSRARSSTRASATWPSSRTPTGTRLCSTGGTRRVSREQALERYQALPLPTTSDEHWCFTDLRGSAPESFSVSGAQAAGTGASMLEIDAAAVAEATEGGLEIVRAPEGITFAPLEDHERLGTLVEASDKLTAHNAALWKHGLLVHVPA